MNQSFDLLSILKGCLSSNTVQTSQKQLLDYSLQPHFLSDLLQLIPDQPPQIVIMIMSTLKNYTQQRYSHPHNPMPEPQKQLLRSNLFNLYYTINNNHQAVNLYKEVVHMVIAVDFQKYQQMFYGQLHEDLNSGIAAAVYVSRQIARVYEWLAVDKRQPLERFISTFYPNLQQLVQKILSDYNNQTRKLLEQLLQMFYSSFHIQVPQYLRNFSNLDKWMLYLKTILKAPIDDFPQNHILVSRIFVKLFSMYCRDGTDGKQHRGWGAQFRQKYAMELYNHIVQILVNPLPNQDIMTNILLCLSAVTNNPDLRPLLQESHCQAIIYTYLLPFMESTNEDYSYFKSDGLQYIRRCEDLTCHPYRQASLDLIKSIAQKFSFGNKSQLIKFVEYSAQVLGGTNATDKQKQVVIITLTELAPLLMKNKYLKQNFQTLVQQYFIPLLKTNNHIIVAQTLNLLAVYLKKAQLSTNVVTELISLIYDKMCEENIVTKYYAVRAFTELLDDKQALQATRPHFQNILSIYVKLLDTIDHEGLISSLKSIVQVFSNQIIPVANDLANHLFNLFYSMHSKQPQQNDDNEQNQSKQATAALSTIKQILQSPLSAEVYYSISQKVMILLQSLCSEYDDYFQEILNILNTLVYHAKNIVNYEFPYLLCRKLLEGNNGILCNCNNSEFLAVISQAEKADVEYSETLISIIKNLIQKMPDQVLHSHPLPTNPQLLLCLIENKKLESSSLQQLNLSQLDNQWSLILQSYTSIVYNLGQVCNCSELKMLNGVSLYPWIQTKLDGEVVKKLMNNLEDQQAEDEYYEENTVQMLQKFADEDDDGGDYYISSGGNYSYMYDSPFNPDNDQQHLLQKLKQLPANQLNYIINQLSQKHRKKLQQMFQR